jgi:hypothetical protein
MALFAGVCADCGQQTDGDLTEAEAVDCRRGIGRHMRPPSERTTPHLALKYNDFSAGYYYSVLVDRHRLMDHVLRLIIGLDLLHPSDRKLVQARFGDVERRHF